MTHTASEQDKVSQLQWQADQQGSTQDALAELASFPDGEEQQRSTISAFADVVGDRRQLLIKRAAEMGIPQDSVDAQMEDWTSKPSEHRHHLRDR